MNLHAAFNLWKVLLLLGLFGLLFVILTPKVSVGPASSEKAQAKNDVTQIAIAVLAFEAEYGGMPGTNFRLVDKELIAVLSGKDLSLNPREIVFLEVTEAKNGRSGLRNGTFVDPWGGGYQIALAPPGSESLFAGTNGVSLSQRVAVWNDPRLGRRNWLETFFPKPRPYLTSWD